MSRAESSPELGHLEAGVAAERQLRWAAADLTAVVEDGRRRLDLSPLAAVALGRCGVAAALLLRMSIKRTERLSLEARGDGPMGRVYVEVRESGEMRGLVGSPRIEAPGDGSVLRLGPALGKGLLKVRREEPSGASYESQVALVSGEIGTDVAHYLEQSEQRQSAVLVGVLTRPEGVTAAGGLIVEALPDADFDTIRAVERNVARLGSVSRSLEEIGLTGILSTVLGGFDRQLLERRELRYACGCSRERLRESLASIPVEQLGELVDDQGRLAAECAFCGTVYRYGLEEVLGEN